MPSAFDGKDAWWLLGRPVARLRDIEPLFTSDKINAIHAHLSSFASVNKKRLRKELLEAAGYYFYVKDLDRNYRPSAQRRESRAYKKQFEKTLNMTLGLSSHYLFNLVFASGDAIRSLHDGKLDGYVEDLTCSPETGP